MSYCVYVIKSETSGRYYCGYTSDMARRLRDHNDPEYRHTRTTKVLSGPWKVIWSKETAERTAAMELEKRIRKRGIGRFLYAAQSVESRSRRD